MPQEGEIDVRDTVSNTAASLAETHSAVVMFIGDRAYKLKKPVKFGFLDFSTVGARRRACHREVDLNRRLAPDVYLGVADLVGPDGALCDHLVVMRRMPADRRLTACIERDEDVGDALRYVAHDVAALHASSPAATTFSYVATAEAVGGNWDASFAQMAPDVGPVLDSATASRVEYLVHRYLDGREELFQQRIKEGWVRDGHGDLQADDIFLLPDGPRVLDCIEFSDELRWGDILSDVAFLAMDLERVGRNDLAEHFLAWHREFSADSWPSSLAHHYIAYRAHVRAKVTAIRHHQGDPSAQRLANRYLDLACTHLEQARVKLILIGGLPGTGKSTLASAIGEQLSVVVLRSDEIRTHGSTSHGRPVANPYAEGRYSREAVTANYSGLISRAAELVALGESVVLDASWSSDDMRVLARAMAERTSSDLVEIICHAPAVTAAARIWTRRQRGDDPSEATPEVAAAMASQFDPWPEAVVIATDCVLAESVGDALHSIAEDRSLPVMGHD